MTSPEHPTTPPALTTPAAVAFYLGVLLVAVVWAFFTEPGLSLLTAWPQERAVPWWAAGLAAGLALVVGTMLAEPVFPALQRLSAELAQMLVPITPARVVILALLSGLCEEALFRGPVQHSLGYVLASLAFALLHGGLSARYFAWSTFALIAALLFGLLAELYSSFWPGALAHVVVNGINLRRLGASHRRHTGRKP